MDVASTSAAPAAIGIGLIGEFAVCVKPSFPSLPFKLAQRVDCCRGPPSLASKFHVVSKLSKASAITSGHFLKADNQTHVSTACQPSVHRAPRARSATPPPHTTTSGPPPPLHRSSSSHTLLLAAFLASHTLVLTTLPSATYNHLGSRRLYVS